MASKKNYKTFEKTAEVSNGSISNSGSSSKPESEDGESSRRSRSSTSCPAVLEPSKDEFHRSDRISKNIMTGLFMRSCPQPSTKGPSISCSEQSHGHEDQQQHQSSEEHGNSDEHRDDEVQRLIVEHRNNEVQQTDESRSNFCANFMECYKSCVHKIGLSWFIYIFQLFISVICISAIVMGVIFYSSCEGKYSSTNPFLNIVMGICGLVLVYMWFAKVRRQRRGGYFWNHQKNWLIGTFSVLLFASFIEFSFSTKMTMITLQEEKGINFKCPKTYYDFLFWMHIVNAVCLLFAAFLYLPDCCIYIYSYRRLRPSQANGHCEPI